MPSLLDLRRTTAALVAVAMSAALIAFAFIISDSARTQMQTNARLSVGDAAIVVQDGRGANSTEKALDDDLLNRVSALDGVDSARTSMNSPRSSCRRAGTTSLTASRRSRTPTALSSAR